MINSGDGVTPGASSDQHHGRERGPMMRVGEAKAIARQWVMEQVNRDPTILAAYFAGSTNWKPDDAPLPAASDIDVNLVVGDANGRASYFKQQYDGVVLDVSYKPAADYTSPEKVLSNYHAAQHFTTANVIYDPSDLLTPVQAAVRAEYAKRHWVRRRCEDVQAWLAQSLRWFSPDDPYYDQVFTFLYPYGVVAQALAVADLRNPTVRQNAVLAAQVTSKYGETDFYNQWLALLGVQHLQPEQVEALLDDTLEAMDAARPYARTPFFGLTNLSDFARPMLIDGIRDIIDQGYPREAVLWLGIHQAWSQKALHLDAPDAAREQGMARVQRFLDTLGITSAEVLRDRHRQLTALAPALSDVIERILAANSAIVD
jgi:hypothetical protein